MNKHPISIIIPVYKNYEMFYKYLEINKKHFDGCEVIVANDYPEEKITRKVKQIYSNAIIMDNKKNLGFAGNVNRGVRLAKRPYVFLMNSDVVLKDASFKKSVDYLKKDKKLFAIGFAQLEKDGKIVGSNRGYFQNGFINHAHQTLHVTRYTLHNNFWAEGGASIFNRKLFMDLGMLDELYNPFYWEDIDLSYKAWRAGYEVKFDPSIVVEHHHESTIGKYFQQEKILRTAFRNQLVFHWKNITDKDLLIKHLINLPRYIFTPGFFDALLKLPKILQARKETVRLFKKTDREILDLFISKLKS